MSLNCLTCHSLQRTDSEGDYRTGNGNGNDKGNENYHSTIRWLDTERNWSGPLRLPPNHHQPNMESGLNPAARKRKKGGRTMSTGAVRLTRSDLGVGSSDAQPKLIRSGGMRRDWSFEDLRRMQREAKERENRHQP